MRIEISRRSFEPCGVHAACGAGNEPEARHFLTIPSLDSGGGNLSAATLSSGVP